MFNFEKKWLKRRSCSYSRNKKEKWNKKRKKFKRDKEKVNCDGGGIDNSKGI